MQKIYFHSIFIPKIIAGVKGHTLRRDSGGKYKDGALVQLVSYLVEHKREIIIGTTTISVQPLEIQFCPQSREFKLFLNDFELSKEGAEKFALNDGFERTGESSNYQKLIRFVGAQYNNNRPPLRFKGKVIFWGEITPPKGKIQPKIKPSFYNQYKIKEDA